MTVTEAFLSAKRMSVDYAPAQAESLLEEAEDVSGDEMGDALGGDVEGEVEEKEYLMEQRRLGACMEDLSRQLREKEAQMRQMGQVSALKAAYDKKLAELESERSSLEEERGKLQKTLREMKRSGAANAAEKEARHRQRLGELEGRLKSLEREQRKLKVLEKTKAQAEEACTKLEAEIRAMKQQRVQLAKQMEAARKEFQEYRKEKEKEAMQLKREGRKNRLQMERIKALHEKQQQVGHEKQHQGASREAKQQHVRPPA